MFCDNRSNGRANEPFSQTATCGSIFLLAFILQMTNVWDT